MCRVKMTTPPPTVPGGVESHFHGLLVYPAPAEVNFDVVGRSRSPSPLDLNEIGLHVTVPCECVSTNKNEALAAECLASMSPLQ